MDTKIFTLVWKFDLLVKNFNLCHISGMESDTAFIFHMCIPCKKTFQIYRYKSLLLKKDSDFTDKYAHWNIWVSQTHLFFYLFVKNFNIGLNMDN